MPYEYRFDEKPTFRQKLDVIRTFLAIPVGRRTHATFLHESDATGSTQITRSSEKFRLLGIFRMSNAWSVWRQISRIMDKPGSVTIGQTRRDRR